MNIFVIQLVIKVQNIKKMEEEIKSILLQCKLNTKNEIYEFNEVKKAIGIKNNSELIRVLIKIKYSELNSVPTDFRR